MWIGPLCHMLHKTFSRSGSNEHLFSPFHKLASKTEGKNMLEWLHTLHVAETTAVGSPLQQASQLQTGYWHLKPPVCLYLWLDHDLQVILVTLCSERHLQQSCLPWMCASDRVCMCVWVSERVHVSADERHKASMRRQWPRSARWNEAPEWPPITSCDLQKQNKLPTSNLKHEATSFKEQKTWTLRSKYAIMLA